MPNWCFTHMVFHGNKKEIEELHAKIEEWTSKSLKPNGFGNNWLGNIIIGAGLGEHIDSETDRIRCRGELEYVSDVESVSDEEAYFEIDQYTAWAPMCALWSAVIDKLEYKSIGYSYIAEEPGMQIYEIYDPYGDFPDSYYVDVWLEDADQKNDALMKIYDDRYYADEKSIIEALQKLLNTEETDYMVLKDKAENYPFADKNSYLIINEYDIVDEPYM